MCTGEDEEGIRLEGNNSEIWTSNGGVGVDTVMGTTCYEVPFR